MPTHRDNPLTQEPLPAPPRRRDPADRSAGLIVALFWALVLSMLIGAVAIAGTIFLALIGAIILHAFFTRASQ
jgi:hypothetical protein